MHATAQKKKILRFLRQHPLATISTISTAHRGATAQKPQSALVAFCETENLEIIFETFYDARKTENLKTNQNVALVIGWDAKKHITLQYEGKAHPVAKKELERFKKIFLKKKTPCTEEFLNHPKARLYKVTPTWIRYADYTRSPKDIFELSLK